MLKEILGYVAYALFGIAIALIANIFFGLIVVDGNSMNNTLKDNQILFGFRYHGLYKIKAGDIIVANIIRYDTQEEDCIIKRVIATEGQTVEIKKGKVLIDGQEIIEDYIKEAMNEQSFNKITVPEGEVYVMGDNRNNSLDSRIQGTIKKSQIELIVIK